MTGMVHSVRDVKSSNPTRFTVPNGKAGKTMRACGNFGRTSAPRLPQTSHRSAGRCRTVAPYRSGGPC